MHVSFTEGKKQCYTKNNPSTCQPMLRYSWNPALMLSFFFNGDLVTLLFLFIHLAVAAMRSFTAHRLQLIFRFTQTWKHICLASCPKASTIPWDCNGSVRGLVSLHPRHHPFSSSSFRHCQLGSRPHSMLKADTLWSQLSCFLWFSNPLRICLDTFTSQLCHRGYRHP